MKKTIIYIIICIFLLQVAISSNYFYQNTFKDGTSSLNLTGNVTKYIELPKNSDIVNATIDIVGLNTRNLSYTLMDNFTYFRAWGSNTYNASHPETNSYDGDYNTYTECNTGGGCYYWLNYTLPLNESVDNIYWQVKDASTFTNLSIPNTCRGSDNYVKFYMILQDAVNRVYYYCINETDGIHLLHLTSTTYLFYEEALYYNYQQLFPENVVIRLNNSIIFNHTGNLTSQNKSINLSTNLIETYLKYNKTIPFTISALDWGRLLVQNLSIYYGNVWQCDGRSGESVAYNFTFTDEDNSSILRGNMAVDLTYSSFTLSFEAINVTNVAICTGGSESYTVNGEVRGEVGYTNKYFLRNATFNNVTRNIKFYNKADITNYNTMVLTLRDDSFFIYPNIIGRLERYYPQNHTWIVVQQDDSDEFGRQFFMIIERSVEYRLKFYRNTTLLDSTEKIKFLCDTTTYVCEVSFQIIGVSTDITSLSVGAVVDNSTKMVNITWNDATGETDSVRFVVQQQTLPDVTTICDISVSSGSGSTQCNVSGYEGQIQLYVYSPSTSLKTSVIQYLTLDKPKISDYLEIGDYGIFTLIILVTFVGLSLMSPAVTIIGMLFSLIVMHIFGLNPIITIPFVIIIGAMSIAIGLKVKK